MPDKYSFPLVNESLYFRRCLKVVDKGYFITIGKLGAAVTLTPDLMW